MLLCVLEEFAILMKKFEKLSREYQNYLIARFYKPRKVKKQFSGIKKFTREEVKTPKF